MKLIHRLKLMWRAPERMAEQNARLIVLERNMITLATVANDQVTGLGAMGAAIVDQANAIKIISSAVAADLPGESVEFKPAQVH